ncbi:MAG: hypothetical protein RLZZ04_85 [Cyanobacteriota bacterium]|jgi:hypothetical protein
MLCSSVLILSIFIGSAIASSNRFAVSGAGLEITKTAIANQAQLEQALLLIKLQQEQIAEAKARAIAVNQRTNVGGLIVEDLSKVEALFPPSDVKGIEQTIERSQAVLNQEINN